KRKEQGPENLALAHCLRCGGALLRFWAPHARHSTPLATRLGSGVPIFLPRLGLPAACVRGFDPPSRPIRVADARPSVTGHLRSSKKKFSGARVPIFRA